MKRTMLIFALLLALALTVLLASCSPRGESGGTTGTEGCAHVWDKGKMLTSPTCLSTGSILYTCTLCGEKKTEEVPADPTMHSFGSSWRIVTPPTATQDGVEERVCTRCFNSLTQPVKFAAYSARVTEIKDKATSFASSAFGSGSIRTDLGTAYTAPSVSPTKGQHPRVLFRASDLAGINAELHDARSSAAGGLFRAAVAKPTDGKLKTGTSNFSEDVMSNIQMLALDYALTGNAISGYSAINAIKTVITTLDYSDMSDKTRYYGCTMYIAACVYDWCYDLMDKTDRDQIVLGVQKKCCESNRMEVGFPPSGQSAISGHGCEYQILRDYLAFAIAIYDEYPGWWNYIGGRYYKDFVPIRERYYEAGMVPQGVSLYVQTRYAADLYSAWLIYGMTGSIPYEADDMKQVARTIFSHELPGWYKGKFYVGFNTGDDHVPDGSFINYGRVALISSYLFDDATMRAELEYFKSSYSDFSTQFTSGGATVSEYLICSSHNVKAASDRHEGMDLILYNGGWLGQTIARNSWNNDQAAVLMKIGGQTTANHDHRDAGQFQIFYREMLAGDTGAYVAYGSSDTGHHRYYHQATIAHNSLLIYNPSQSSTDDGYYSGGQNSSNGGEITDYSNWLNKTKYVTGEVSGHAEGYADAAETTPTYAYIAGDIAKAYSSSTVSEVTRRMLAVYETQNADVPMYFFVFDNITAKSDSYKKTFLLHTPTEPEISGNTVTVTNGNGKLVLQNVFGAAADGITKIGGHPRADGKNGLNYVVNGKQLDNKLFRDDEYWGRVEISPATGNKTDQLLNVMYVCDAGKNPTGQTATPISTTAVKGAQIGNTAAIFVIQATRRSGSFSFSTTGSGNLNYYVSGVKAGKWNVLVGSTLITIVTATEEGGFVTFTAPAGTITLNPVN